MIIHTNIVDHIKRIIEANLKIDKIKEGDPKVS